MSIHPDHFFPNSAPKGYHTITNTSTLFNGDICWDMSADTWGPIRPKDIGRNDTTYMRLARPNRNSLVARARRTKIDWQPMRTASRACRPLLLKVNERTVMGRALSLSPRYVKSGWFLEQILGWTTEKRIYPTGWALLPPL